MNPVILAKGLTLKLVHGIWPAILVAGKYQSNNALALYFVSDDDLNEPLCKSSLNQETISGLLPFNQFLCKDYSENEGMVKFLTESGIAIPTGGACQVGYEVCEILQLNDKLSAILKEAINVQTH